jgi:hypothetical protein
VLPVATILGVASPVATATSDCALGVQAGIIAVQHPVEIDLFILTLHLCVLIV